MGRFCFLRRVTLLTTVICGLAPALRATRRDLQPQLAGSGKGAGSGVRHGKVRAGLVIGQVALSIVLLIEAGLMMRSLYKLTHIDLGFNAKNILVAAFAPSRKSDQIPDRALMVSAEGHARFRESGGKDKTIAGSGERCGEQYDSGLRSIGRSESRGARRDARRGSRNGRMR